MEHNFEPMTTGMVLDRSFRLYLDNFALMVGLSAILNVPLLTISFLFTAGRVDVTKLNGATAVAIAVGVILFLITAIVVAPMIAGATALAVSDIYLGRTATAGAVLSAAWRKVWTLLKTQIIVGLILIGLMLAAGMALGLIAGVMTLLSVPAILIGLFFVLAGAALLAGMIPLLLSYALIAPIVMIEGSNNGREIRNRSWRLVNGNRFKVFLIFLVLVVIQLLVQAGVAIVSALAFGFGNASITASILDGAISILLTPISAIAVTLLYYDFRIRKEGFDLEMLSQSMGGSATEA